MRAAGDVDDDAVRRIGRRVGREARRPMRQLMQGCKIAGGIGVFNAGLRHAGQGIGQALAGDKAARQGPVIGGMNQAQIAFAAHQQQRLFLS